MSKSWGGYDGRGYVFVLVFCARPVQTRRRVVLCVVAERMCGCGCAMLDLDLTGAQCSMRTYVLR